jgi:hypothetical protein
MATMHSMTPDERGLALQVLADAWSRVASAAGVGLIGAVESAAQALAARRDDVSPDYAEHLASAAVWYLDRAVRRVGDADLDGHSAAQRTANLAWLASTASPLVVERLFAMAAALNADDA